MTDQPELNEESYARWLRARQPHPLGFFFSLSELEQETLAGIGDDYTEDVQLAFAYVLQDPDAVMASNGDGDAEERLAKRVASEMLVQAESRMNATVDPSVSEEPGMAGVTNRRAHTDFQKAKQGRQGKSLLGRAPDPIETPTPLNTLEADK